MTKTTVNQACAKDTEDDCIMICGVCRKDCHWDDDGMCPKCAYESGDYDDYN